VAWCCILHRSGTVPITISTKRAVLQVTHLGIFQAKESDTSVILVFPTLGKIFVDLVDAPRHMVVRLVEQVAPLFLQILVLILCTLALSSRLLSFLLRVIEISLNVGKSGISAWYDIDRPFNRFHIRRHLLNVGFHLADSPFKIFADFLVPILQLALFCYQPTSRYSSSSISKSGSMPKLLVCFGIWESSSMSIISSET
jgi:hypothetical protein